MRKIICLLMLSLVFTSAIAQTRVKKPIAKSDAEQPARRPVTIMLKQGDPVKGRFIKADNETIKIEVAGNEISIKADNITGIEFIEKASQPAISKGQESIKALRKIQGALEIGISPMEYSSRLIDLKSTVEDESSKLPDGELKNEILSALDAFIDWKIIWDKMRETRANYVLAEYEPGISCIKKYSIPIDRSGPVPIINEGPIINNIWTAARNHIEKASALAAVK